MARLGVGEYLRDQRRQARLTLRQLAEQTGVSNPYLADPDLTERQKSALLDIYSSFRSQTEGGA